MLSFLFFLRRCLPTAMAVGLILLSAGPGFTEDDPIRIEADRMVSQEQDNSVVFIGNVDASQGQVTIRSDEMTVFYVQNEGVKGKKQSNKVKKLTCIGNVEVTQDDWLGTGKRMDYFAKARKVILTGDAKAWQGQNMIAGKTIIYYLDEKRSIVEQDKNKPGRVRAVIHPESDAKKK